jgi:hypothetical protein
MNQNTMAPPIGKESQKVHSHIFQSIKRHGQDTRHFNDVSGGNSHSPDNQRNHQARINYQNPKGSARFTVKDL